MIFTHRRLAMWQPFLCMAPLLFAACSSTPDVPQWFDAVTRMPVRTVLVDGQRIAYLDVGDGPPVILIHGFTGSMWHWEYQQEALSKHFRVITLDLLGSGLSDKPEEGYTPTELVEFFRKFMDALHLEHAALAGNSMGAGLAIGMALSHPERVDRLILISGFPDRVRDKLASPRMLRLLNTRVPAWLASLVSRLSGRSATRDFLSELVHDRTRLTPAVIDRSFQNRRRPGLFPPLLALSKNLPLWEDGFAARLAQINHHTLIIWGQEDRVFPLSVGNDLHRIISGSVMKIVPEAGHLPQWERPDLVNSMIREFLSP
jgi:pimeloyl-ACP methyl ester carboxylesterase